MSKLVDSFPELVAELENSLRADNRTGLASQLREAMIREVTFDNAANAGYIYLEPTRALNIVEANIIGERFGQTVPVKSSYWTNIDTDNFERIVGIEVLDPGTLKPALRRLARG